MTKVSSHGCAVIAQYLEADASKWVGYKGNFLSVDQNFVHYLICAGGRTFVW